MIIGAVENAMDVRDLRDILKYNIRYLFHDYFNFLANLFFGKKYYVKVNGVWSAWRGRQKRNKNLLVRYGVDKHKWELSEDDYKRCKESNKEKIQQKIIDLNVRDLQSSGPRAAREGFIRNYNRQGQRNYIPIEDIDREMQRILANMDMDAMGEMLDRM